MDAAGVATAITAPGFVARELRFKINRECNEFGARMAADHRGRFGLFASLPLPDVNSALEEIGYVLATPEANGIGLLSSYENKWLGDLIAPPDRSASSRATAPRPR